MTKYEKKKLDKMWSEYIRKRANDQCERCGIPGNNPHHIIGRRSLSVRWDIDNGVCLCSGCHVLRRDSAHQDPLTFIEWLTENKGKEFLKNLRMSSNLGYRPDYKALEIFFKNKI